MTIQFNTDNNITGSIELKAPLIALITEELSRFSQHITRLEVHLSDENSHKEGPNDIRCVLEARIEGRQPIAVTNQADTHDLAVEGALNKLKNSLNRIVGRMRNQ